MKTFVWTSLVDSILYSLRIVGLSPKNYTYGCNIYTLYALIVVPLLMFGHPLFQVINMFMIELDPETLAACIFVTLHVIAVIKICAILLNLRVVEKLVAKMNYELFQPKDGSQVKRVAPELQFWGPLYKGFFASVVLLLSTWCVRPIWDKSYKNYELPVFAWYPVDVKSSPFYQIVYVYQMLGVGFVGVAQVNADLLFLALTIFMGAQCDILCENLREVKELQSLITCIEHHNEILRFSADFHQLFGKLILAQFFSSVSSNVLALFRLSLTQPGSPEFFLMVFLSCIITSEIFLYCWYGNQVNSKSSLIPLAAYNSHWPEASVKFQKVLLTFLTRTQEPLRITALNLFPLSLTTFLSIMKNSWSYFVVLRQVKVEK